MVTSQKVRVEFIRKDFIKGLRPPAIAWHWRAGLNSKSEYSHCYSLKALIRL
jgi:hypothetical protein